MFLCELNEILPNKHHQKRANVDVEEISQPQIRNIFATEVLEKATHIMRRKD